MLCVVIKGPSYEEIHQQIAEALCHADLVELRVDLFSKIDLSLIKQLRAHFKIPMIFTIRSLSQGGSFKGSEKEQLFKIEELATLAPEYVDLESHVPTTFAQKLASLYPKTQIILSCHHFEAKSYFSLQEIDDLYQAMRKTPASFYKIALKFNKTVDTLAFLLWARQLKDPIIPISMGEEGLMSRLLAPYIGAPITYCSLSDEANSLGQLSAKTLNEIYHYKKVTPQTALYGLIGHPVSKSISDVRHNYVFGKCGLDALYVKIALPPQDLKTFLNLAKQVPFKGLSVTMPLKEEILSYLTHIDLPAKEIGAVNTLVLQAGDYIGFNTDGKGALDAIEKMSKVQNKKILILGAGGAAKAIIYESLKRGACVTIANRDLQKATSLAKRFSCEAIPLTSRLHRDYDILINCTPAEMPIAAEDLLKHALIMDIKTQPRITPLLEKATELGAKTLSGDLMFLNQAILQYSYWFKSLNHLEPMGLCLSEVLSSENNNFLS